MEGCQGAGLEIPEDYHLLFVCDGREEDSSTVSEAKGITGCYRVVPEFRPEVALHVQQKPFSWIHGRDVQGEMSGVGAPPGLIATSVLPQRKSVEFPAYWVEDEKRIHQPGQYQGHFLAVRRP